MKKDCSYLCMWTISNWLGKSRTRVRLGKFSEPTSFLDHVYLGCTQGECQISKDVAEKLRSTSKSRISAGATEKNCQQQKKATGKPGAETKSSWSYDMEGRRNAWRNIANLRIKQLSNFSKWQRHAWTIINLKKKKMDHLENCLLFAHKLF